jgi:hypothetical protein
MNRALMIGLCSAAFCVGALASRGAKDEPAPVRHRLFQLRTYTAREGQMEAVLERFRKHGVDLFKKHGIEVIGFWTPHSEKDGKGKKVV